jgi:hypothetical protein
MKAVNLKHGARCRLILNSLHLGGINSNTFIKDDEA